LSFRVACHQSATFYLCDLLFVNCYECIRRKTSWLDVKQYSMTNQWNWSWCHYSLVPHRGKNRIAMNKIVIDWPLGFLLPTTFKLFGFPYYGFQRTWWRFFFPKCCFLCALNLISTFLLYKGAQFRQVPQRCSDSKG
jgi:hypothetical protein